VKAGPVNRISKDIAQFLLAIQYRNLVLPEDIEELVGVKWLHGETRIRHGNSLLDCRRHGVYLRSAVCPVLQV
jgi:hypothetical protein